MRNKKVFYFGIVIYIFLIYIIFLIEHSDPNSNIKTFTDAIWYTIVTLTTVGYGDYYPVTNGGKILGLFIILGSVGILGYLIGEITYRINTYMEKKKQGYYGTKFENHYVIIGWNDFARQVANQIYNAGQKIALITNSKEDLELFNSQYDDNRSFALFTDYKNVVAFNKVNIIASKAVFVNFKEDTETLVFVLNIKKDFPNLKIIINCTNPDLRETLENTGVSHVVSRNEVASRMVASYLFEPHVAEYTSDLISTSINDTDHDIQQYIITDSNPYKELSYLEAFIKIKKELHSILIGLVVDGKLVKDPDDDQILKKGNYLIIISTGNERPIMEKTFGVREGF